MLASSSANIVPMRGHRTIKPLAKPPNKRAKTIKGASELASPHMRNAERDATTAEKKTKIWTLTWSESVSKPISPKICAMLATARTTAPVEDE